MPEWAGPAPGAWLDRLEAERDNLREVLAWAHDEPTPDFACRLAVALHWFWRSRGPVGEGRRWTETLLADAQKIIASSLAKERDTIRVLRDLSFAIEPLVLRDQGFYAAVRALGDQVEETHRITVVTEVEAGEELGEKSQVALYQIIRESLNQAVRRRPEKIEVGVRRREDGGFETEIADDGVEERRRASIEAIDERVRILN